MRTIRTLADVQIVLKALEDRLNTFDTTTVDRHGLKFTNNGKAVEPTDYVIFSQLPEVPPEMQQRDQHYTQVWSNGGTAIVGAAIPPFVPGRFREGTPIQAWVAATTAPATANLTINIQLNGTKILLTDLTLPNGQQGPVMASNFITPLPYMHYNSLVIPVITGVASASAAVAIGLVIKRNRGKSG